MGIDFVERSKFKKHPDFDKNYAEIDWSLPEDIFIKTCDNCKDYDQCLLENYEVWTNHKGWVGIDREWKMIASGTKDWCEGFLEAASHLAKGNYKLRKKR